MLKSSLNFLHKHVYYFGGIIVVSGVYVMTGVLMASVAGYVLGISLLDIIPRIIR